jgi:hypothetical protein
MMFYLPRLQQKILLDLLARLQDILTGAGCGDYPLPNTDDYWNLFVEVRAHCQKMSVAELTASPAFPTRPTGAVLNFTDEDLLSYFLAQMRQQLNVME